MAIRHGLAGNPPRNVIGAEEIASQSETSTSSTVEKTIESAAGKFPGWAKGLIVTALTGGGIGAATGIAALTGLFQHNTPPAITQQVTTPAAAVPDREGDLIPWLKNNGYNLRPTAGK